MKHFILFFQPFTNHQSPITKTGGLHAIRIYKNRDKRRNTN